MVDVYQLNTINQDIEAALGQIQGLHSRPRAKLDAAVARGLLLALAQLSSDISNAQRIIASRVDALNAELKKLHEQMDASSTVAEKQNATLIKVYRAIAWLTGVLAFTGIGTVILGVCQLLGWLPGTRQK